jgi:hypothetical protein
VSNAAASSPGRSRNYRVLDSEIGPPCKRCGRPLEVRVQSDIDDARKHHFYWSKWFYCTNESCSQKRVLPKEFRVMTQHVPATPPLPSNIETMLLLGAQGSGFEFGEAKRSTVLTLEEKGLLAVVRLDAHRWRAVITAEGVRLLRERGGASARAMFRDGRVASPGPQDAVLPIVTAPRRRYTDRG